MPLEAGRQLGVYEVISPLGAGGMGEVYRARDTKLQRDVALKILPDAMAHNAERMARFEREAQVLASLNHPNIASIYGLEESNGVRALVMELVEGETLGERLRRAQPLTRPASRDTLSPQAGRGEKSSDSQPSPSGRGWPAGPGEGSSLAMDDALPIARQIAEALEYAHERGVIHRDLKPANVKITPEGAVKVLDFGLAKVLDTQDSTATLDAGDSPTLSAMATQAGMILGTAAYMSPEQAKGQRVDRRADIWAFGCVLYEMLTGRKPFEGETISEVLAAVIRAEPDWTAIPDTTPPSIQKLIRRCLQKDQRQRLQAIGEARIAIEETLNGSPLLTSPPPQGEGSPEERDGVRVSPLRRILPWAVAGLFVVTTMVAAIAYFRARSRPAQPIRSLIAAPEKASFAFDRPSGAPLLSPDGTRLVFPVQDASGKEALWVRPLDSLTAQRLQGTEGATYPFWSPDSRYVGFFQDGKLKKIDVTGGPPVLVGDAPDAYGGAWSRNDVIVLAPRILAGGLSSVPAAGGTPTPIASHKGSGGAFSNRWPVFLPDGRHFLYLSGDLDATGTSKLGIYVGELGTNEAKFLLQADSDALYAAPGYLLFLRGDTLMAQRFDAGNQKLDGDAFPVAEHVGSPQHYRLGLFSVSQTGLLVYDSGQGSAQGGRLVWVDAHGKETGNVGPAGVNGQRLSPDGKQVAYVAANSGAGTDDIWLMDLDRGVQTRFTFSPGRNEAPVWSPDGARIAYTSARQSQYNICVKNASGAGSAEPLFESDAMKFPTDWSRDGRYIAIGLLDPKGKTKWDIWMLPLFGDRKPFPYLQTPFNEGDAVFSPDGHWLAYGSDESGSSEIYLSPFPGGGAKWQVSQGGGVQTHWSRDGASLYYLAPGGKLMEASVKENGSTVEIGTPRQLFQEQMQNPTGGGETYAVAPDGKRFLVDKAEQGASLLLTLVANWTGETNNR